MVELKKQNISVSGLTVVKNSKSSINLSGDFCGEMVVGLNDLIEYLNDKNFNASKEFERFKTGSENERLLMAFKSYLNKNKAFSEKYICGFAETPALNGQEVAIKGGIYNAFVVKEC